MTKEQKANYERELAAISELFPRLQQLSTEFGLDYYGTQVHQDLEETLSSIRERNVYLKHILEKENSST